MVDLFELEPHLGMLNTLLHPLHRPITIKLNNAHQVLMYSLWLIRMGVDSIYLIATLYCTVVDNNFHMNVV